MSDVEAVVLTGGRSTRMGEDKASLLVDGKPMAELTVGRLLEVNVPVTVCGLKPLAGCAFIRDYAEHAGPLAALSSFSPTRPLVFLAACDMPRFDAKLVETLSRLMGSKQAAVPNIGGQFQPLAALYSAAALSATRELFKSGKRSMMAWLEVLDVRTVFEDELAAEGIEPGSLLSANTPEDLERLTQA